MTNLEGAQSVALNAEQTENMLRLVMNDPMLRQMEMFYRMPDTEDSAMCLAVVIQQLGPSKLGVIFDPGLLEAAIEKRWAEQP